MARKNLKKRLKVLEEKAKTNPLEALVELEALAENLLSERAENSVLKIKAVPVKVDEGVRFDVSVKRRGVSTDEAIAILTDAIERFKNEK